MEPQDDRKSHRQRHSGRKAVKKKGKQPQPEDPTAKQRNPKAFAFNSAVRAERRFRRKEDIDTKKQHVPVVDRSVLEPPPILVAVVGPPKVGKSTLIKNLIKLFTRSPLVDIKGPVTVVIGKKRRVTFIECNNDINCMIDLAKVADLVLLLCDASFGFEMEVFEFLNVCQVHGMPKIMGVLTHLDLIKNAKTLKTTKKVLKHRFWTEVYPGAKLFYLSGIIHEEYLRNEIKNLGRFISVMKVRPLTWRNTHAYLLADRLEDLTNQERVRKEPKCDRHISLYGFVRGVPIKPDCTVHVAGLGDFKIGAVSHLPDPCPLPEQLKKRALIEKEKLIYAPFSGVGGIVYDKDAVYVELGGSHSHDNKDEGGIVSNLMEAKNTIDYKMAQSKMQIFSGGQQFTGDDFENGKREERVLDGGRTRRKVVFQENDQNLTEGHENEDSDDGEEEENEEVNIQSKKRIETSSSQRNIEEKGGESEDSDDSEEKENDQNLSAKSGIRSSQEDSVDEEETKEVKIQSNNKQFTSKNKQQNLEETEETDDSDEEEHEILKQTKKQSEKDYSCESEDDEESEDTDTEMSRKPNKTSEKSNKSQNEEIHSKVSNILKMLEKKQPSQSTVIDNSDFDKKGQSSKQLESEDETSEEKEPSENDSDEESEDSGPEDGADDAKWKSNLTQKAQAAFFERQQTTQNLTKIVYGIFTKSEQSQSNEEQPISLEENESDFSGGLFKVVSRDQKQRQAANHTLDSIDTSLNQPWSTPTLDWTDQSNRTTLVNCFVTGQWRESEDADELLRLDDRELPSESEDGDFEDLETGQVHTAAKRPRDEEKEDVEAIREKKRRLKEKFDQEYDNKEGSTYYDTLKESATKQAELNRSVFANVPDDVRVDYEGYRPGMYVRLELHDVPYEFTAHFDPTYPLVVGVVNHGEENIGYVNVKIKKHRWYKKILKSGDPLIISLGWRRFQTIPLYSKLEDDLKYRYLKYTPEHLGCTAHFWGPITPQNTGFVALQSVDHDPERDKKMGFRIAASGVVQELDKTTRVMKKLKLIGQPLKIYKKTAFIKGMFNTALEVARFEGARLKTVSGIRGQIKKAVSKPEGCFRATFEDKILLSDLVFCRTWYKVDVQQYYNPLTNLLLPPEEKNQWKGAKTTGEIKREKGIKNQPNLDSLYTPIEREEKPFKPLIIPSQLQRALPYRDKPKHEARLDEKKNPIQRVAVVREPKEEKIAKLMKMVKANYQHKQEKLKRDAKERVEKHRQQVLAQEAFKDKKLKQKKKEVFRMKSKAEKSKKNN